MITFLLKKKKVLIANFYKKRVSGQAFRANIFLKL